MSEVTSRTVLDRCKFCDGNHTVVGRDPVANHMWRVFCHNDNCWARGPLRETSYAAIAAWNQRTPPRIDVYHLANVIRTVDGSHTMGAGELAEAIVARLEEYDE